MICYHRATEHLPSNYTFCKYWVYETENLQKSTVSITDCLQNAYVYQLSGMRQFDKIFGIRDLENPILTFPPHSIVSLFQK